MRTELGEVKHRSIIYNIPLLNAYKKQSGKYSKNKKKRGKGVGVLGYWVVFGVD
jgi:hypothetical protein